MCVYYSIIFFKAKLSFRNCQLVRLLLDTLLRSSQKHLNCLLNYVVVKQTLIVGFELGFGCVGGYLSFSEPGALAFGRTHFPPPTSTVLQGHWEGGEPVCTQTKNFWKKGD